MQRQIRLKSHDARTVLIVLFLFIGIFMPCLIRVRMQYVILGFGLSYVLWNFVSGKVLCIPKTIVKMLSSFIPFFLYYSILIVYKVFVDACDFSVYFVEYKQSISIALYIFVFALAISIYNRKNAINTDCFYKMIIGVGILQLFFVLVSFIFPSIKSFFNDLIARNSFQENIVNALNQNWYKGWRAFGLAENYYDGFGFVISIIISVAFVYGLKNKSIKITLLSWVMLIMPLLNARTGLVLCFFSFVFIMFRFLTAKRALGYSLLILLILVGFPALFNYLPWGLQDSLSRGLLDVSNLLKGQKTGVFSDIVGTDIVYPNSILFGAGISPERIKAYEGIDSGYIQSIWRFGLIGSVLLWSGYISCFWISFMNTKKKENRVVLVTVLIIMLVYCFKLFLFSSYANNFLIFTILFVFSMNDPSRRAFAQTTSIGEDKTDGK